MRDPSVIFIRIHETAKLALEPKASYKANLAIAYLLRLDDTTFAKLVERAKKALKTKNIVGSPSRRLILDRRLWTSLLARVYLNSSLAKALIFLVATEHSIAELEALVGRDEEE